MNASKQYVFLINNKWNLLFCLTALELVLACSVPATILTDLPFLGSLVNILQYIAPVLGKITHETATNPDAVRFYIFLTILILPLKVWIFFSWLNSDRTGIYRFLVISPLTDQRPAEGDNFITDPLRQKKQQPAKNKPRSMTSRLIWSILILLLTFGLCWTFLEFDSPDSSTYRSREHFRSLVSEGFNMWLVWTIQLLTFTPFLLAVSISILRDYGIYLKQSYNRLNGEHHE